MKASCPRCSKQFVLSTQKLQGRVLRVRCTSCGSVFKIRVATPEARPQAGIAQSSPAPREKAPDSAPDSRKVASVAPFPESPSLTGSSPSSAPEPRTKYFAVIGKRRLGPMPYAALRRLVIEEKIKAETLVWHKGLVNWVRAEALKELEDHFQVAPPPVPEAQVRPPLPPPLKLHTVSAPKPAEAPKAEAAAPAAPERAAPPAPSPVEKPPQEERIAGVMALPVPTPEEEASEEVKMDSLDSEFFQVGAEQDSLARAVGELEIADEAFFPGELEEMQTDKGAKASLRDFSVMVRLSRQSRRKNLVLLLVLGSVAVFAMAFITLQYDPLNLMATETVLLTDNQPTQDSGPAVIEQTVHGRRANGSEDTDESVESRGNTSSQSISSRLGPLEFKADSGLATQLDGTGTIVVPDEAAVEEALKGLASDAPKEGRLEKRNSHTKSSDNGKRIKDRHSDAGKNEKPVGKNDDPLVLKFDTESSHHGIASVGEEILHKTKVVETVESVHGSLGGEQDVLKMHIKVKDEVEKPKHDIEWVKNQVRYEIKQMLNNSANAARIARCIDNYAAGYQADPLKLAIHFNKNGKPKKAYIPGAPDRLTDCLYGLVGHYQSKYVEEPLKVNISLYLDF